MGASLFTFTEVDNDTLRLSAKTDNVLLGLIKLNVDYEISGDVMKVEIGGKTYQLKKQN